MKTWFYVAIYLLTGIILYGCQHAEQQEPYCRLNADSLFEYQTGKVQGKFQLIRQNDSLCVIRHLQNDSLLDEWKIEHEVYQFDCGDLTGDSIPEIAVGVIKPTRFRPYPDRRLFIFHLCKGIYIRPLWLGSRVGRPLKDFAIEHDTVPHLIHTWEYAEGDSLVECLYRYEGFGLKFVKYIND